MKNNEVQATITEEIPEWKLKLSYFYSEHHLMIKRTGIFLLFFADLVIVFLFGSIFINYQTGILKEHALLNSLPINLISHTMVEKKLSPQPLEFGKTQKVPARGDKYDILLTVKNRNQDWAVEQIRYTFTAGGQNLEPRETFILPKSEKPLMYFGARKKGAVSLKVLGIKWKRIRDYSLISYKDSIKIDEAIYTPSSSTKLEGEIKLTVFNDSPFDFWEVGLPIVLVDNRATPIGITYTTANQLKAQEKREISIGWHDDLIKRVRRVEVTPEVNLLNADSIMKIEGKVGPAPGVDTTIGR